MAVSTQASASFSSRPAKKRKVCRMKHRFTWGESAKASVRSMASS